MYAGVPAKAPNPLAALRCNWCLLVWGLIQQPASIKAQDGALRTELDIC